MDTHLATASLPWIDGPAVRAALSPRAAVDALEAALAAGLDPEADAPRTRVATAAGQLLQMPSTRGTEVGTKLLTLTPVPNTTRCRGEASASSRTPSADTAEVRRPVSSTPSSTARGAWPGVPGAPNST